MSGANHKIWLQWTFRELGKCHHVKKWNNGILKKRAFTYDVRFICRSYVNAPIKSIWDLSIYSESLSYLSAT